MKRKIYFVLFLCILSLFSFQLNAQKTPQNKITKLWETKDVLKTPESALYDVQWNVIYVSDMNNAQEGAGFISKLSPSGEIINLNWITGLTGPKGMGISGKNLYVTSTREVVEIDISQGKIIHRYTNSKALDLNDITVSRNGTVYVSDTKGKCLFNIGKNTLEVFIESDQTDKCNGLLATENELLAGGSINKIIAINYKTKAIRLVADNTGYVDGLVSTGKGSFITSDWKGKVQLIEPGKPIQVLYDTSDAKINAADLDYIISKQVLLVPTFYKNKIIAYKLNL